MYKYIFLSMLVLGYVCLFFKPAAADGNVVVAFPTDAGTGFVLGDRIRISGASDDAVVEVSAVVGNTIDGITIVNPGTCYPTGVYKAVILTGSGSFSSPFPITVSTVSTACSSIADAQRNLFYLYAVVFSGMWFVTWLIRGRK